MITSDRGHAGVLAALRHHIGDVEIIDVARPKGGWGNLSYRVDTSTGSFIITRFSNTPEPELRDMANLLVELEEAEFPSPRLVPHRDGGFFSEWDGYPALVKHYIEGVISRGVVENDPGDFGEIAARFHLATRGHSITRPHKFGRTAFHAIEPFVANNRFAAWLGTMAGRFDAAIDPTLPSGLVHGDLVLDNIVRSPDGTLSMIDLENSCREALMFDLGMIVFTLAEAGSWSEDMEKTAVEGYERVRKLEPSEVEAVPLFVSYAAAAIGFVRFQERRIEGGDRVRDGTWMGPQSIADAAWTRFAARSGA